MELARLAAALGVDGSELIGPVFQYPARELVRRNVQFLIEASGCKTAQEFASRAGVQPATLSRWRSGKSPEKTSWAKLASAAGVADLGRWEEVAWFLVYTPLSTSQRRQWVVKRVKDMDAATFEALYPAFERLLGER
jgi:transcriptional regulator with XRE-family HTH domain